MASRKVLLIATAAMAVVVVVVVALLPATASAEENYVVGDDDGWDLGVNYNDWASGKTFNVGDTLQFVYSTEEPFAHNVVQLDEASFDECSVPSNARTWTSGDDSMRFGAPGQYFFICSVDGHCESGMKLALNVQGDG